MPELVIGHTTETTARIWLCGDKRRHTCEVVLEPRDGGAHRIHLLRETDYTRTVEFKDLRPDTEYRITATFAPGSVKHITGRFRTFKQQLQGTPFDFSFVLSSCNLPVVGISNLLAYILAVGGTSVAVTSLELPVESWRYARFVLLRRVLRRPARWLVMGAAGLVKWMTELKQTPPPFLRSPFLKLSAVFESCVLEVVAKEASLPSVGDTVLSENAKGVVACSAIDVSDSAGIKVEDDNCEKQLEAQIRQFEHPEKESKELKKWRVVLTHVEGEFAHCKPAEKQAAGAKKKAAVPIGTITRSAHCHPWYERPSFFIHAGDQIYYDFPTEKRPPLANHYRLAYREAWFDDAANRYLLSHWPQYMTLDDHEIADQFSNDFNPPEKATKDNTLERVAEPAAYLKEAMGAYRDYVQERHPEEGGPEGAGRDSKRLWYCFAKGDARFFVLDTRTERFDGVTTDAQIIGPEQMRALIKWMSDYRDDLKFVVTSVPFVAEIDEKESQEEPKWTGQRQPRNLANDKWNAVRFRAQRSQIINHIYRDRIERLVFLTGDMHCCYHATMRIGTGSKYHVKRRPRAGGRPGQSAPARQRG